MDLKNLQYVNEIKNRSTAENTQGVRETGPKSQTKANREINERGTSKTQRTRRTRTWEIRMENQMCGFTSLLALYTSYL